MADLTMCTGEGCPLKENCYRYLAEPSGADQEYFGFVPVAADGTCEYYLRYPPLKVRIGNQTAFSSTPLTAPFEYTIARRFDAFEWFPDKREDGTGWTVGDVSFKDFASIRSSAKDHDVALSVHASLRSSLLTDIGRNNLLGDIEFGRGIGAGLLNVHLDLSQGMEAFVTAVATLEEQLADMHIHLAIENTVNDAPENFNDLFAAFQDRGLLQGDRLGMCFDIGHANLCAATPNDYLAFIDQLSLNVPITHLHLHENWGDEDSHLTLFTGPAGRDASGIQGLFVRLVARGFWGVAILEQWPEPRDLLDTARNRLQEIISNCINEIEI